MREKWYFTFGLGHFHANEYVVLLGDIDSTRARMNELFGNGWSSQYDEKKFLAIKEKYNLAILYGELT